MSDKMPRLSVDLSHERHPNICQACGAQHDIMDDVAIGLWMEYDAADQPSRARVVLCNACSKKLIKPHPRLYGLMPANGPWAGATTLCADCTWRRGLTCTHPEAKDNGGPGVKIMVYPGPVMHLNYGGGRGEWIQNYDRPPTSCSGRVVAGGGDTPAVEAEAAPHIPNAGDE